MVEAVPASLLGSGKGNAGSGRAGWPPGMPPGHSLYSSLCIPAAVPPCPIAAWSQWIFSRYQVKPSLMSMPKTCLWMVGVGSWVSRGWVNLPDGKTLVPCISWADFTTSFTHHINSVFINHVVSRHILVQAPFFSPSSLALGSILGQPLESLGLVGWSSRGQVLHWGLTFVY